MHTLTPSAVSGAATNSFHLTHNSKVWLHVVSATNYTALDMQKSIDGGTTYSDFYPDGELETFTGETTKLYDLPAGWHYRLDATSATGVSVYVGGNAVVLD